MKNILTIAAAVAMAIAAAGVAGSAFAADAKPANANPGTTIVAPRVTVTPAVRKELVETVTATGTLVPRQEVLVGPEIDGLRILEILAEEGDTVIKNQILIRLSRETLDAKIAQSDAALARADAAIAQVKSQIVSATVTVTLTNQELDRAQKLIKRGASTRAIIDQKMSAANTAKAQLQVAKGALAVAEADKKSLEAQRRELMISVTRTEIKAPMAGLISNRTAKIGALAAANGAPLFRIIAGGAVELDAEVTERGVLAVKRGQKAKIYLANNVAVDGQVRLVSPQIDATTRLGHVRVSLTGNGNVRIGAFARALIEIRRSKSLTVPISAIIYSGGKTMVHVAAGNIVKTRAVKLGLIYKERAEILRGLDDGDEVVMRAGAFLRDGDAIDAVRSKVETR